VFDLLLSKRYREVPEGHIGMAKYHDGEKYITSRKPVSGFDDEPAQLPVCIVEEKVADHAQKSIAPSDFIAFQDGCTPQHDALPIKPLDVAAFHPHSGFAKRV